MVDFTAATTTSNTVTVSGTPWTTNAYVGRIVDMGSGRYGTILSNTSNTLTIDGWTTGSTPSAGAAAITSVCFNISTNGTYPGTGQGNGTTFNFSGLAVVAYNSHGIIFAIGGYSAAHPIAFILVNGCSFPNGDTFWYSIYSLANRLPASTNLWPAGAPAFTVYDDQGSNLYNADQLRLANAAGATSVTSTFYAGQVTATGSVSAFNYPVSFPTQTTWADVKDLTSGTVVVLESANLQTGYTNWNSTTGHVYAVLAVGY
jgi:hypothetical protein